MIFVYQAGLQIIVSAETARELRGKMSGLELLRTFRTIQDALAFAEPLGTVVNLTKKTHQGLTPEGRQRMRDAKMGEKNPNSGGLTDAHKKKIAETMKTQRYGEFHHMWRKTHRSRSKMQTSWSLRKLPPRKWAVDLEGVEHRLGLTDPLPEGWVWGRARVRKTAKVVPSYDYPWV
jgi:hypothetical protein